jgi:hypothetical protein
MLGDSIFLEIRFIVLSLCLASPRAVLIAARAELPQ